MPRRADARRIDRSRESQISLARNHRGRRSDPAQTDRNSRFQEYLKAQTFFRGGAIETVGEAIARAKEAVFDGVQSLARLGVREAWKGRYHTGEALAWSSLNFADRQAKIVETLSNSFAERTGGKTDGKKVFMDVAGRPVLFVIHAIPAALTIANAREMVGRPFLRDCELAHELTAAAGPVHVIGCQKSATETQAISLLGFPDATVITDPFGVYVADPIHKVQFVYLQNCREATTSRFSAQRFFDWLVQSSEDSALVQRAEARARIVQAIAKEVPGSVAPSSTRLRRRGTDSRKRPL